MRSIFQNDVIFYGVSANDKAVSGQLDYLANFRSASANYYLLTKEPLNKSEKDLISRLPVEAIAFPANKDWDECFSIFIDNISAHTPADRSAKPVLAIDNTDGGMISPEKLQSLPPNEIRTYLNSISGIFFTEKMFNDSFYQEFCQDYDIPIHIASRVRPGTENKHWFSYEVMRSVGAGNFGSVFEAKSETGGTVAVKIAHEDVKDDKEKLNNFRRGVSSMRVLTEAKMQGVVPLISATELPPSIVMEFVNGVNLEDAINRDIVKSPRDKFFVLAEVSRTIKRCHGHKRTIFHRDLRPANIMIAGNWYDHVQDGEVLVLDFDLSWHAGANNQEYILGAAQALGYLAPEKLNTGSKYSTRSALVDVFGLSMLTFFMFKREHPVANQCLTSEWARSVEEVSTKALYGIWRSVPSRVSRLILRGTSEDQKSRPLLDDFLVEIETLFDQASDNWIDRAIVILEEIMFRVFLRDYTLDPSKGVFSARIQNAGEVHSWIGRDDTLVFKMSMLIDQHVQRRSVPNSLKEARLSIISATEKIEGALHKVEIQYGGIVANLSIPKPQNWKQLEGITSVIEKARLACSI